MRLEQIEPLIIERTRDHEFKRRRPKKDLKKGQQDLCHCGYGKHNPIHHAFPESTNERGSGNDWTTYQSDKKNWTAVLSPALKKARVPTGMKRVYVEAEYTIGRKTPYDQDNLRYPVSKVLGDVMRDGGWIADDSWDWGDLQDWQFEFGGLRLRYEPEVWKMTLIIFPTIDLEVDLVVGDVDVDPHGDGYVDPLGAMVDAEPAASDADGHGVRTVASFD